jgi:uncharacterized protein (DUF433 family)
VLFGKQVTRGTQIPIEVILEQRVQNPDVDELFADYSRLAIDEGKPALA